MGTICLQCGDRGFTNAFVYCVKCLDIAVHRYCLDVIPETFDEFVHWVCDDCEAEKQKQSVVNKLDVSSSQKRDCGIAKNTRKFSGVGTKKNDIVVTEEYAYKDDREKSHTACKKLDLVEYGELTSDCWPMQLGDRKDKHTVLSAVDERKRCDSISFQQLEEDMTKGNLRQHSKLSYDISIKEIMKTKKRKHPKLPDIFLKEDMNKSTGKHRFDDTWSEQSHEKSTNLDISERARLVSDSKVPTKHKLKKGTKQRDQRCISWQLRNSNIDIGMAKYPTTSCNVSLKSLNKKRTVSEAILQEQMHGVCSPEPLSKNEVLNSEDQGATTSTVDTNFAQNINLIENRESGEREERTSAPRNWSNFCKDYTKDLQVSSAAPVFKPIWRGIFNIWDKKHATLEGLVAHMSSKACQKVYEAACQFQPVLHLEKFPMSEVWPKSFERSEPSGDNIALYFFPSKISESGFDHLVEEMTCKELALKASVQNAELLIFTSTELPLLYWRFQGKHYLWGVFRGKQSPSPHSHSSKEELGSNPLIHTDSTNDHTVGEQVS